MAASLASAGIITGDLPVLLALHVGIQFVNLRQNCAMAMCYSSSLE